MQYLLVQLVFALLLTVAALARAQQVPEWLEQAGESEVPAAEQPAAPPVRPPDPTKDDGSDAPPRGMERRESLGGPFLEDYIVRPRARVETLGDRARTAPPAGDAPGWIEYRDTESAGSAVMGAVPFPADGMLPPGEPLVAGEPAPQVEGAPATGGSRYRVQPSDVLTISVWREPDLEREVTVSPDGWISFPLLGELRVEDSTVDEIRAYIEAGLGRYMSRPAVNVSLRQTMGNRIFVVGNVNSPGVYGFAKQLDVMQALTLAGGTAKFADLRDIRILRRTHDGRQIVLPFNFAAVRSGRELEQNVFLLSGDVVMVP